MLWSRDTVYVEEPFNDEPDFEGAIREVKNELFGEDRIYIDIKMKIGRKGKTRNIPDAYLVDLSSKKEPKLYVVENELERHDPLKHIAVQILEFSLSYETEPHKVKKIVREGLARDRAAMDQCAKFANDNGYENLDLMLERMIYKENSFSALVIIDKVPDELENVLISKFKFPVEIVSLQRFKTKSGDRLYKFDPFLIDITMVDPTGGGKKGKRKTKVDIAEIDTIVVPAREDGFKETFLGENCWYSIRIHSSMIQKIKYIAAYQVAPISAITHIASVDRIEQWKDSGKYILYFAKPAKRIRPIRLVPNGDVKPLYSPRYAKLENVKKARTLDDVF